MPITRPLLPPKAGYVEVVDENGNHVYKPTKETEIAMKKEADLRTTQDKVDAILGDPSESAPAEALEFNKAVQLFAASLTDEMTILEIPSVFPLYAVGTAYKTGDIFRYGANSVGDPQLWQVLQDHTSAAEWTPPTAVSLYKKIGISEDGTPIWVQPLGATDAYNAGDIVLYKNEKYKSLINANVWSPDAYPAGWEKLTETTTEPTDPEPDEPSEPSVPEFVQPTGAHDAYGIGDRVTYNGHIYESTIDGNTWSPDAYPQGWTMIE